MKYFVVLFALVAAVSAGGYGGGHGAEYIHVGGGPAIPAPKAAPLALAGNDHTTRIHYSGSGSGGAHGGALAPHLVGVEVFNPALHYEPSWTNVAVGGHGGNGGHGGWH